jgi:hypothetical protein
VCGGGGRRDSGESALVLGGYQRQFCDDERCPFQYHPMDVAQAALGYWLIKGSVRAFREESSPVLRCPWHSAAQRGRRPFGWFVPCRRGRRLSPLCGALAVGVPATPY